jgi:hypothetical protein
MQLAMLECLSLSKSPNACIHKEGINSAYFKQILSFYHSLIFNMLWMMRDLFAEFRVEKKQVANA